MRHRILVVAVLLCGCASSTGIVAIGDGLYMSATQDYSLNYHGAKVKVQLYQEAAEFCAKQGKKMVPVSDTATDAAAYSNYASAEVKFRCT